MMSVTRHYDILSKSLPLLAIPPGLLPLSPLGVVVRGEVLHLGLGIVTTYAVFFKPSLRHNLGSLLYAWYLAGQVAVAGEEAHAGVLLVAVDVLRHRAEGGSVRVRGGEVANLVTNVHNESTPFPWSGPP